MEISLIRAIPEATICPSLPKEIWITTVVSEKLFIVFPFTLKSVSVWTISYMITQGVLIYSRLINSKPLFNKYFSSAFCMSDAVGFWECKDEDRVGALEYHIVTG